VRYQQNWLCDSRRAQPAYAALLGRTVGYPYPQYRGTPNNYVLRAIKMDIKDAFGSIDECNVRLTLEDCFQDERLPDIRSLKYYTQDLERIVNVTTFNGSLPQGAPSSPVLLNLCLLKFDRYLLKVLAKLKGWTEYTRYADDIVVSCSHEIADASVIIECVKKSLNKFDLRANHLKTKIMSKKHGVFITGINAVNFDSHLCISRKRRAQIRAIIHQASFLNDEASRKRARARILGNISHVMAVDKLHGLQLALYGLRKGILVGEDTVGGIKLKETAEYSEINAHLARARLKRSLTDLENNLKEILI
jgi:retron-type reverse transcriptase